MTDEDNHFEKVWCKSETIANSKYKNDKLKIFEELTSSIKDYVEFSKSSENISEEVKNAMHSRQLGAILFILTGLSATDNINVWKSLENEMSFEEMDLKEINKLT